MRKSESPDYHRKHLAIGIVLIMLTLIGCASTPGTNLPADSGSPSANESAEPVWERDSPTATKPPALRVPQDYSTIQAAIDAANEGDVIVIEKGAYTENINFNGKNITLRSSDPDDPEVVAATILDGDSKGAVVTFQNSETIRAQLIGFTITGGSGNTYLQASEGGEIQTCRKGVFDSQESKRFCGGGIVIEAGAWPLIEKNNITGNGVFHSGGGIFVGKGSFPIIRNNTITDNRATGGGGIYVVEGAKPTIEDNLITSNDAQFGGGILADWGASPFIEGNTITDNTGQSGGGLCVFNHASAMIVRNLISGNEASGGGGAIFAGPEALLTVKDNIISENTAGFGGAVFIELNASLLIEGNTIINNIAWLSGGGVDASGALDTEICANTFEGNYAKRGGGLYISDEGLVVVDKNIFHNNTAEDGGAIWTTAAERQSQLESENTFSNNQPDDVYAPGDAMSEINEFQFTILYDNTSYDNRLTADWGFSALIEYDEFTLLFDTGANGEILKGNAEILGVDLTAIDAILLTHEHRDHTGGVDEILSLGITPTIYAPASFAESFLYNLRTRTEVVTVTDALEIVPGMHSTGVLGSQIPEQALVLETHEGSIIITGCAHPGIIPIVHSAKAIVPGDVALVVGGFHLGDLSRESVWDITAALKNLGVLRVTPTHCTGEMAIEVFAQAFDENYIEGGAGRVISEREWRE